MLFLRQFIFIHMKVQDKRLFIEIFKKTIGNKPHHTHSTQNDSKIQKIFPQNNFTSLLLTPSLRKTIVSVEPAFLKDCLNIYQWREQTEYPIVSSRWIAVQYNSKDGLICNREDVMRKTLDVDASRLQPLLVEVETEWVQPLSNYSPLSFLQLVYCYKETVVGLERLLSMFGYFELEKEMLTINKENQLKVWLSTTYDQNIKGHQIEGNQKQLVYRLRRIFIDLAADGFMMRNFFNEISEAQNLLQLMRLIQKCIEVHKIKLSKNVMRPAKMEHKQPQSPREHQKINHRIPKFLSPSRSQNKCSDNSVQNNGKRQHFSPWRCHNPKKVDLSLPKSDLKSKVTAVTSCDLAKMNNFKKSSKPFGFKSLSSLQTLDKLKPLKTKTSQIYCNKQVPKIKNFYTMTPTGQLPKTGECISKNFDHLFDDPSHTDHLSVSINLQQVFTSKKTPKHNFLMIDHYGREATTGCKNSSLKC